MISRIKTGKDLNALRDEFQKRILPRITSPEESEGKNLPTQILVCVGGGAAWLPVPGRLWPL